MFDNTHNVWAVLERLYIFVVNPAFALVKLAGKLRRLCIKEIFSFKKVRENKDDKG
ncbi:hypothetical protein HMPREF0648_0236 [Prevotella bivia JCVIHMP010]|nr:hypothetical protein HMPREF0648_0236 [Prevotella bivia JCVIHMP010]